MCNPSQGFYRAPIEVKIRYVGGSMDGSTVARTFIDGQIPGSVFIPQCVMVRDGYGKLKAGSQWDEEYILKEIDGEWIATLRY